MTNSIQTARDFLDTLNTIEKDWDTWVDDLKTCEQEIQDLLHEIELTKFDACRGYQLCKQLQQVRQRRRKLKDQMEINSHLRDFIDCNKQLKISLFKVLSSMKKTEEYQSQRIYTPRVRTDLSLAEKLG
ncbi:hypothetical protein JCM15765_14880 [Paradesulfitobacterium aromaticivorans]